MSVVSASFGEHSTHLFEGYIPLCFQHASREHLEDDRDAADGYQAALLARMMVSLFHTIRKGSAKSYEGVVLATDGTGAASTASAYPNYRDGGAAQANDSSEVSQDDAE